MLQGFLQMISSGTPIPENWKKVEEEIIRNVGLPLFMQNAQNVVKTQQGMQQLAGQQESQLSTEQSPQPQEEMAA